MSATASRYSAQELASLIGQRFAPTPEQQAVIEAGDGPALVVAGAGSGKTETMAARVVWLVANGIARPGEILGLTFTRKAAGELSERVRSRLAQLPRDLVGPLDDPLDVPEIATYNSFANTLYREHALLIGREPDAAILSEASAWQLAYRIVSSSADERLTTLGRGVAGVAAGVLDLAHALSDNDVADPEAVARHARAFHEVLDLPGSPRGDYVELAKFVSTVGALPVLVDLAVEYADEKHRRGFIEFSDQVALALHAVERAPGIADDYRDRYRVVLLDEYQDTSVAQTELLARLFAGHSVMAVGDPNQSIYGWRGASAANLAEFSRNFDPERPGNVASYSLSTSWRNPVSVLDAANLVATPLREKSPIPVEKLHPRPGASAGQVSLLWRDDVLDEARAVAAWFAERLGTGEEGPVRGGAGGSIAGVPTAAMLCRSVKNISAFTAALREANVRYHVLGIGGLLEEPAVVDVVCALRVLVDPGAGSELIRLLAGARWRIGPKDIQALRRLASELERRDHRQQKLDDDVAARLRGSVVDEESASIVDALDWLATASPDHGWLGAFSDEGVRRLRQLGALLARLRLRTGLELVEVLTHVIHELGLDIEVRANDASPYGQADLDAFVDLASGFVSADGAGAQLRSFLGWLDEAERRERLSAVAAPAEPGTVQIMTIHAAKGLEWDLVAIPRVVEDELPGALRDGANGWLSFGELPYEFRGDRLQLPALAWRGVDSQKDVLEQIGLFKGAVKDAYLDEQRRLMYVAVTRARGELVLSGSYWSTQKSHRGPSEYLRELHRGGMLRELASIGEPPPASDVGESLAERVDWPHSPLGARAERVHAAADGVAGALALARDAVEAGERLRGRGGGAEWADQLDSLIAERDARLAGTAAVALPVRIPASKFKDYVTDTAHTVAELVRPMPDKPYRQTRLGTLFHSWVEQRSGLVGTSETVDSAFDDLDDGDELFGAGSVALSAADSSRLAELKATFETSWWAARQPVEVEIEVHLPLADRVLICKLDAVYRLDDGRYQIVDWKTGAAPRDDDPSDLQTRQLQLALYRLAYARWKGIDPTRIDAVFYFVAHDRVVRPERIYSESELLQLWASAASSSTGGV